MSVAVGLQALTFFGAAACGLGLGIFYDIGRALRRAHRRLTLPVDMAFGLIFFFCLCLTVIYTRGLRLYQCLGMFLGAGLWNLTLSPGFLRLLALGFARLEAVGRALGTGMRKSVYFLRKTAKKLFPSGGKWGTIFHVPCVSGRWRAGGRRE